MAEFARIYGKTLGCLYIAVLAQLGLSILLPIPMMFLITIVYTGPAILFGEKHFTMGIGIGPNDATGLCLTLLFYAIVGIVISCVIYTIKRNPKKTNRSEQNKD